MGKNGLYREQLIDALHVQVYENREAMGAAAARDVSNRIQSLLAEKTEIRMIFAAAPSQNEFLANLAHDSSINWSRIHVFHMDEYIELPQEAPQAFGRFLCDRLFDIVRPKSVHLIDSASTVAAECERYSKLLQEAPIDIVCLGIGENGHLAFNDPPVADFEDPMTVKAVELDHACRLQQVNDGCFAELNEVPTHAITLTIPALLSGQHLYCIVPGATKRAAVQQTLHGDISTSCPATILRRHPSCTLYADADSYGDEEAASGRES